MIERIRKVLGRPTPDDEFVDAQAQALLTDLPILRPAIADDLVAAFREKVTSEKLTGTVEHLGSMIDVPQAVARYVEKSAIQGLITISDDPRLAMLDWSGLAVTDAIEPHRGLAVGLAQLAIAETGSVVMASSKLTPSLQNFLPLHHLVIVPIERLRANLGDVWLEIDPRDHRLVTLITGTSGTADIEGRNVRGAHGPRFLHVLLIDEI